MIREKPQLGSGRDAMPGRPLGATLSALTEEEDEMTDTAQKEVSPGDVIAVSGHRVGEAGRMGEILEVLGEHGHEHYRVRWEDGSETIFYPSSDAVVSSSRTSREKKR
jgi:hypothetical protein